MKFNSQICTTEEQSKRLLALGLKKETADMSYQVKFFDPFLQHLVDCTPSLLTHPPINDERFIPAWSLHRLIEMIPSNLSDNSEIDFSKFGVFYAIFHNGEYCLTHAFAKKEKVLYDNIIYCIEWLIKEGHFNKEYLEE